MSTPITNGAESNQTKATAPGQKMMGVGMIVFIALYLVGFSLLVLYGLVKLWPHPTPSGEPKPQATASPSPAASPTPSVTPSPAASPTVSPSPGTTSAVTTSPTPSPTSSPAADANRPLPEPDTVSFFGGRLTARIYSETRLLLLVILAGALGSLMHAVRSLYWYTGNRDMVMSWAAQYFLLPFTGSILAVIFYFVVRGGFFSPQASFETTSPFGFAALSALVGLFSPQATLKLKEIAETVFAKPAAGEDPKPQETVSPPKSTETTITPPK